MKKHIPAHSCGDCMPAIFCACLAGCSSKTSNSGEPAATTQETSNGSAETAQLNPTGGYKGKPSRSPCPRISRTSTFKGVQRNDEPRYPAVHP